MVEHTQGQRSKNLTFILLSDSLAKGREEHNRKGSCIFPSVDQVGEDIFGVTVASHALGETKPSWQYRYQWPDSIDDCTTLNSVVCVCVVCVCV